MKILNRLPPGLHAAGLRLLNPTQALASPEAYRVGCIRQGALMNEFWKFLSHVSVTPGKLPLVHTTDMHGFKNIEVANALQPQPCPLYGGNLLYFFYGRPAYRAHRTVETTTAKAFAPVCFIMGDQLDDAICRIMPFDSGAFHNGLMHPPMHPDVPLSEYELAVDANAPMKLIKLLFWG